MVTGNETGLRRPHRNPHRPLTKNHVLSASGDGVQPPRSPKNEVTTLSREPRLTLADHSRFELPERKEKGDIQVETETSSDASNKDGVERSLNLMSGLKLLSPEDLKNGGYEGDDDDTKNPLYVSEGI